MAHGSWLMAHGSWLRVNFAPVFRCPALLVISSGRLFPDFVVEWLDGHIAVVDYKEAHLLNDHYEIEKRQTGEVWARKNPTRCLFRRISKARDGVGMSGQLHALPA